MTFTDRRASPLLTRRRVLAAAGAAAALAVVPRRAWAASPAVGDVAPDAALERLRAGNRRFAGGNLTAPRRDLARVAATAAKQRPFAAILCCADSRVPPEIIYDQGFGDLFVVRLAGNVVTPEGIASLEYGTLILGASALVVLGHAHCGAVEAAMRGEPVPGQISALFQHIAPGIDRTRSDLPAAIEANVRAQEKRLREGSPVLAGLIAQGKLALCGAVYDLASGAVRELT